MRAGRGPILAGLLVVVSNITLAASGEPTDDPDAVPALQVTAEVRATDLVAAGAITDSLESGVRRVMVRVVDQMELAVTFESQDALTLSEPLYLCLVGPYAAPDDAGLSDRCWGEPDLATLVGAKMSRDADGSIRLEAGEPVVVSAVIGRGDERCDYPPGTWSLEVGFSRPSTPTPPDEVVLDDVPFDVPPDDTEPLPLLAPPDSRYCGLASAVVREQGEPEVIAP